MLPASRAQQCATSRLRRPIRFRRWRQSTSCTADFSHLGGRLLRQCSCCCSRPAKNAVGACWIESAPRGLRVADGPSAAGRWYSLVSVSQNVGSAATPVLVAASVAGCVLVLRIAAADRCATIASNTSLWRPVGGGRARFLVLPLCRWRSQWCCKLDYPWRLGSGTQTSIPPHGAHKAASPRPLQCRLQRC